MIEINNLEKSYGSKKAIDIPQGYDHDRNQ